MSRRVCQQLCARLDAVCWPVDASHAGIIRRCGPHVANRWQAGYAAARRCCHLLLTHRPQGYSLQAGRRCVLLWCDAEPWMVSPSTQQLRSTSGAPLQSLDGPAKAARLYLSPYGRASFNMAAVGRTAALTGAARGSSDGSCPGFLPGQLPSRAARPTSTTQPKFHGVGRCTAAPRHRTLRPSRPTTPRPRANLGPLLPSQVARWSPPAPPMDGSSTSGGRGRTATAADAATGLSAARSGGSSEVRLCGSYAYVLRMYMHLTAYHPFLTDSGDHGTGRTSPKHHF